MRFIACCFRWADEQPQQPPGRQEVTPKMQLCDPSTCTMQRRTISGRPSKLSSCQTALSSSRSLSASCDTQCDRHSCKHLGLEPIYGFAAASLEQAASTAHDIDVPSAPSAPGAIKRATSAATSPDDVALAFTCSTDAAASLSAAPCMGSGSVVSRSSSLSRPQSLLTMQLARAGSQPGSSNGRGVLDGGSGERLDSAAALAKCGAADGSGRVRSLSHQLSAALRAEVARQQMQRPPPQAGAVAAAVPQQRRRGLSSSDFIHARLGLPVPHYPSHTELCRLNICGGPPLGSYLELQELEDEPNVFLKRSHSNPG